MRDFRKLIAWQKAHELALAVHSAGKRLLAPGAPGLRTQLLRAASSIPAKIAEGCGKRSEIEFARYLDIALGSARERENHLILARDLESLDSAEANRLLEDADEVRRILYALGKTVRARASG